MGKAKTGVMDKVTLTSDNQDKWISNLKKFLIPVAILYLTTVVGTVSQDHHSFVVKDLIPNSFAQGGIVLYVLNTALDYLRKLQG